MPAGLAALSSVMLFWAFPDASAQDNLSLRRALADPSRGVTDFARDEIRRPVEVLEFLGIHSGMTVMDVYAAGGYYTFICRKRWGRKVVLAQNTERGFASRRPSGDHAGRGSEQQNSWRQSHQCRN